MREYCDDIHFYALKLKRWLWSNLVPKSFLLRSYARDTF